MKQAQKISPTFKEMTQYIRTSQESLGKALELLSEVPDESAKITMMDIRDDLEFMYENTGDVLNQVLRVSDPYRARAFLLRAIKLLAGEPVGVVLSDQVKRNWTTDADFILDNRFKYQKKDPIGRFAYNPKTKELVWDKMSKMHAHMIAEQSNSPFDDFVRGVYDGNKVMLRWYGTDPTMSAEDIKMESFNAWYDTKQMLEANGLPAGMPVEMGYSTEALRDEVGGWYR